jgi:hypothetical protein
MPRRAVASPALALLAVAIAIAAAAIAGPGRRAAAIPCPAGSGSAAPRLAVAGDGALWLSWVEPVPGRADVHRLRWAERRGGRWSPPRTLCEGAELIANGADTPALMPLAGGGIAAAWGWRTGPGSEIRVARSADGGRSWSAPRRLHADSSTAEHGFVSIVPAGAGARLVWLDGRRGAGLPEGAADMELRTAGLDASGRPTGETIVDARVCDCCPTAAVEVPEGMLVAYRDRSAGEVRDLAIALLAGGRWQPPHPLGGGGWTIRGCPVNGPALAASGARVVAAWFTGAGGRARVEAAFSTDGGRSFGAPIRVDDAGPLGRVAAVLLPDGGAAVAWLGRGKGGVAEVRLARVGREETVGPAWSVGAARPGSIPRLALADGSLIVAWAMPAPAGVALAAVPPADLAAAAR